MWLIFAIFSRRPWSTLASSLEYLEFRCLSLCAYLYAIIMVYSCVFEIQPQWRRIGDRGVACSLHKIYYPYIVFNYM